MIASNGLETTFNLLASTENEAAVAVLGAALRSENPSVRRFAIDAVLARRSIAAGRKLIAQWDSLSSEERAKLDPESDWLIRILLDDLRADSVAILRAIEIAQTLRVERLAVPLVALAEGHAHYRVRGEALRALLTIVGPIGAAAREDRDRPSLRGPILAQLEQTLSRYPKHRSKGLVDAFLAVSTWSDRQLRSIVSDESETAAIVRDRLRTSTLPEVVKLLAAAVGQNRCPPAVRTVIAVREDAMFRDELLNFIGYELQPNVRQNVKAIGMPACCLGGVRLMGELTGVRRISLALLYSLADTDHFRALEMLITALEDAPSDVRGHLLHVVAEIPQLDMDRLLRAAVAVAKEDEGQDWTHQPNAALLNRLLNLLEQGDAAMERVVHRVLAPLRVENVIDRMNCFRRPTQRKIGKVVMRTDQEAVERVRQNLRHPVLSRRLQAIAAADAFGIIEECAGAIIDIARDDHQEARLAAIAALGRSTSARCHGELEQIASGPDSSIRDAAITARDATINAPTSATGESDDA